MDRCNEILKSQICDQIALEEQLYKSIEDKIMELDDNDFVDAKEILQRIASTIENHYTRLNNSLEVLDSEAGRVRKASLVDLDKSLVNLKSLNKNVSKILRDVYSELNKIVISTTQLHTMALALDKQELAVVALTHIQNIAPLIVSLGKLVPEIVTRELKSILPEIDSAVAKLALENTRSAWKGA